MKLSSITYYFQAYGIFQPEEPILEGGGGVGEFVQWNLRGKNSC